MHTVRKYNEYKSQTFNTKLTDKLLHKLLYKTDTAAVTFYAAKAAPPLHHPIKFNKNRREFKEDNLQNGVLSTFTDGGNAGAGGKKSDAKYLCEVPGELWMEMSTGLTSIDKEDDALLAKSFT